MVLTEDYDCIDVWKFLSTCVKYFVDLYTFLYIEQDLLGLHLKGVSIGIKLHLD